MPNYGDPKYWDKRYTDNEGSVFDWLEDWTSLKSLLSTLINRDSKILVVGCGNAEFSENMYDEGYHHVYNIDISSVVIQQMGERSKERSLMKYEVMDCTNMTYENGMFDAVIDKSTIDALLCGDNAYQMVAKMTKEIQRVLKVGGVYIAISYGKPENRIFHLERDHLSFDMKTYVLYPIDFKNEEEKEEKSHYIYVCWKRADADEVSEQNFEQVLKRIAKEQEEEAQAYVDEEEEEEQQQEQRNVRRVKNDPRSQRRSLSQ